MTFRYLLAWLPMIVIGIGNGFLRELTYGRDLSQLGAHQVSTVIALLFFGLYIWGVARLWRFRSARQALAVGLVWLLLTVAFEFGFGHWIAGHSWHRLLHDYDLSAGRLWVMIPIWIAIAPWIFYRLHGRSRK
jgi:hypothetical protein